MANGEDIEMRLWAYIDGQCDVTERSAIEQLMAAHAEWRDKYRQLLDVHQLIEAAELEQPPMRFTRNVMEEIARYQIAPATRKYINKRVIWGIATFFLVLIVGFLVYGFSQIDWSAGTSSGVVGGLKLTEVDYSRMFNNNFVNGFMVLNIILGLMLLDRYLAQRKKSWQAAA